MQTRNKNKKGFTLIEVLGAIAIMIVLFALSVPAVNGLKIRLEMMKLNGIAKEIYVASQNRTIHLRSASSLGGLDSALQETGGARNLNKHFGKTPGDYDSSKVKNWESLYYIVGGDTFDSYVMPDTASKIVSNGNYVIEVSPKTGDVYSVMYTETAPDGLQSLYEKTLYSDRSDATFRNKRVGYYCAYEDGVAVGSEMFSPSITVHNGEELYLDLRVANSAVLTNNASFNVTLKDRSNGVCDLELSDADHDDFYGGQMLLDSLSDGKDFETITGGDLKLGDDITATVVAEYTYGEYIQTDIECMTNVAAFNSLFDDGTDADSIKVSRVRHLENLNTIYNNELTTKKLADRVVQTADIDFAKTLDTLKAEGDVTTGCTGVPANFVPVDNATLFGSVLADGGNSYDGRGNELINFNIDSLGSNVGFFGTTACNLHDIHVKSAKVSGKNNVGALVGETLGGTIDRCGSFVDCYDHNTATPTKANTNIVTGTNYVGGLVGNAESGTVIRNSFGAVNTIGSNYVGGLVGGNAGTISYCYSSGAVKAAIYAGGIVGTATGSNNVSNCYSTSDVAATTGYVSGISGGTASYKAVVSSCNYYGEIKDGQNNAGVISCADLGTGSGTNRYLLMSGYNAADSIKNNGAASCGYTDTAIVADNDEYYSHPYLETLKNVKFPFKFISTIKYHYGNWPIEIADTGDEPKFKIAYYEKYSDGKYGFYAVRCKTDGSYEVSINTLRSQDKTDGKNQTPYVVEDGYALLAGVKYNGSGSDTCVIKTNNGNTVFSGSIDITGSFKEGSCDQIATGIKISGDETTFSAYRLWIGAQQPGRSDTSGFYYTFEAQAKAKGTTYKYHCCYNPHFAKTAINYDEAIKNAPTQPLDFTNVSSVKSGHAFVRSARQLYNLGAYTDYRGNIGGAKVTYDQELDIDYAAYTKSYCVKSGNNFDLTSTTGTYKSVPIGQKDAFSNNYDGHGYEIYKYSLVTGADYKYVGMFGTLDGSRIANVHMLSYTKYNDTLTGSIKHTFNGTVLTAVGGMVGLVKENSTVTNCSISGYDVSAVTNATSTSQNQPVAVGGLVGCTAGTVERSTAVNRNVTLTSGRLNTGTTYAAGIGGIAGSKVKGTLKYCYAGGSLALDFNNRNNKNTVAGGIAGSNVPVYAVNNGNAYTEYCYSYCTAPNTNANTVYYGCNQTSHKCYYLNNRDNSDTESYVRHIVTVTDLISDGEYEGEGSNVRCTSEALKHLLIDEFNATTDASYPWGMTGNYPFPSVIRSGDDDGAYVHYGEWPTETVECIMPGKIGVICATIGGAYGILYYDYDIPTGTRSLSEVGLQDKASQFRHDQLNGNYYLFWNIGDSDPSKWSYSYTYYATDISIRTSTESGNFGTDSKGIKYMSAPSVLRTVASCRLTVTYDGGTYLATATVGYPWASYIANEWNCLSYSGPSRQNKVSMAAPKKAISNPAVTEDDKHEGNQPDEDKQNDPVTKEDGILEEEIK